MNLNEDQKKAADILYGPAVILAGPGSGKTAVITERTMNLIRKHHVPGGNILVVTFTKAAADEMKRRIFATSRSDEEKCVTFGTFHSVFFKILRFAMNLDASSVISESEALKLVSRLTFESGLEIENVDVIGEIRAEIGKVKGNGGLKKDYYSSSCAPEIFRKVFAGYNEILKRNRQLDFDDMLLLTEELFKNRPEILDLWREKFEFIMIDEFQDINPLQYRLIRLIAEPRNNLFIVGDDDQSIYAFRGSDPGIMLGFEKDYPDAQRIVLKKNYRSKGSIVKAAGRLIRHNDRRFPKQIEAVREEGVPPEIRMFEDRKAEGDAITDKIREYRARGLLWSQMAIIYRTNRFAGQMTSCLSAANIPFSVKGSVQSIYSHFAVKDVLSYIMLARGDRKRETLISIMNRPKRYISRDCLPEENFSFETIKATVRKKPWLYKAVEKLEYDLAFIKRGTPLSAVIYIRKAVGYEAFLKEYACGKGLREDELLEVLDRLQDEAAEFRDFESWFEHMAKMKNELERRVDMEKGEVKDSVTVTTMHGAKGLEYDVVFLPDVNEGITPYKKAVTSEEEEQERRMFYVAVTRAAMRLHISYVKRLNGKDAVISRFIKEMLDFS
ncbi:MAG: ATP-dependent helicase [Lachnospiraceae bacterium]|nr:ATP-dependent helicase [Lachnospiraceae bacterium]